MRFCRRVNDTAYLSYTKSTFRVDLTFNPDIRATFQILLFRVEMCAIPYIYDGLPVREPSHIAITEQSRRESIDNLLPSMRQ